jgi:hypothetical protein
MVLRGIFGLKRLEAKGGWRKLHNGEISDFYYSPSIIGMIKSRRKRWAVHEKWIGTLRPSHPLIGMTTRSVPWGKVVSLLGTGKC